MSEETVGPRLRPHPDARFAGESHVFDLRRELEALRAEPHPPKNGHRQATLFQRAPVTQALFAFEPGGTLAEHSANGLVTIQVLEGRLDVTAAGETHSLEPGGMVTLAPRVRHAVRAAGASGGAMLLTVCREAAPEAGR